MCMPFNLCLYSLYRLLPYEVNSIFISNSATDLLCDISQMTSPLGFASQKLKMRMAFSIPMSFLGLACQLCVSYTVPFPDISE